LHFKYQQQHMKLSTIAVITLMAGLLLACGNDSSSNTGKTGTDALQNQPQNPPTGVVYHYACPNNCGGGDTAGECPVCGMAYVHNDAFHQQPGQQMDMPPQNAPEIQMQPPTAEPAQNAAGVWHYTCSAGCPGGAGAQGKCAMCGNDLVHNQAYHQ
jgi:hypothetical protein